MTASPPAKWWHREEDRIVCDLCPRACRLGEGQRGFCFVRQNVGGEMVLTTFGRSTGFCIDPIEKKPLNHFLPGTPVLSFGTAGCNLGCKFCQNWDISKSREIEILSQEAMPGAIVAAAKEHGCRSIAFTYNDPVIWAEYAIETAKIARAEGIKTVAVTAGYICPEAREEFYAHMDAANVDLKAFSSEFYKKLTIAEIEPVLDTLKWLKQNGKTWFEITNLIIPTQNDSDEELQKMCDWVMEHLGPDVPMHFSAFHPDFKMRDLPPTPPETLIRAREIALRSGVHFAYVGNVLDQANQSTYCPNCRKLLIERNHYELGTYAIHDGKCECGTKIAGVFEDERGNWGRKRLPVKIGPERAGGRRSPKVEFSADEENELLQYTREVVESVVKGEPVYAKLDRVLSQAPGYGMFVTLKRGRQLRACIGNWGEVGEKSLGQLLNQAAVSTARNDHRFPGVVPSELPFVSVELSPMYDPQPVEVTGEARLDAIRVGEHGLVINHRGKRGLFLPQVAVEQGWDARTFLEQVGVKAGSTTEAWLDPQSTLMTFRGKHLVDVPAQAELDFSQLSPGSLETLWRCANGADAGHEILRHPFPGRIGLLVENEAGERALMVRFGMSLAELAGIAAAEVKGRVKRVVLLSRPIDLRPQDYPQRHRQLARSAVVALRGSQYACHWGQGAGRKDPVAGVLQALNLRPAQWPGAGVELTAYDVAAFEDPAGASGSKGAVPAPPVRKPWAAGKFFPGEAGAMQRELEGFRDGAGPVEAKPCRGVMLPHAGWRFCGDIIAETLARVEVPDLVVVIGPKHTRLGANWSVSSSREWSLPGIKIPVAEGEAEWLAGQLPGLQREAAAHQQEHGTEVLLPFLHHHNPNLEVVPVVIGAASYDDLLPLAQALAGMRRRNPGMLLVISSDMNHFADDEENRRRDGLALGEFEKGDTRALFEVCQREDISMCGLRPAVAVLEALKADGEKELDIEVTKYGTSAKASGDTSRVVGYAGALIR